MEEKCNKKSLLVHQLEGQQVVEAKSLLARIKEIPDLTDILTDQLLPCQTDVSMTGGSRMLAFIKCQGIVGLGQVFLTQVITTIKGHLY